MGRCHRRCIRRDFGRWFGGHLGQPKGWRQFRGPRSAEECTAGQGYQVTHSVVVTSLQSKTNLGACRKLKPHGTPRDPERWLCGHVGRSRGRWRQLPCKASAEERRAGSSHRSCIRSCPGLSCFVTRVLALSTRVPALACQHSRAQHSLQ